MSRAIDDIWPGRNRPVPGEPDMARQINVARAMFASLRIAKDVDESATIAAGWICGSYREGYRAAKQTPRATLPGNEGVALDFEGMPLGSYRLFTNPDRTAGVICLMGECDGYLPSDSLTECLQWLHLHKAERHSDNVSRETGD